MFDLEKVIRGLECCTQERECTKCPYCPDIDNPETLCDLNVMLDALALLREQEKPDCEHAEHDSTGCLGYAKCLWDDEPIDVCKTCRKYTGNRYEEVSGDEMPMVREGEREAADGDLHHQK